MEAQAQDPDRFEGQLSDSQMVPSHVFMQCKDQGISLRPFEKDDSLIQVFFFFMT